MGVDGVVVVSGVGRVDGYQRQVAQVLAAVKGGGLGRFRLGLGGGGEAGRDAVGVDCDQRGGAWLVLAPDDFEQFAALGAIAFGGGSDLGQHQVAVAQIAGAGVGQHQGLAGAPIDRLDAHLAVGFADDAEDLVGALTQPLDDLGFVNAILQADEADQEPVA